MVELSEVYEKLGDIVRTYHYIERAYLLGSALVYTERKSIGNEDSRLISEQQKF